MSFKFEDTLNYPDKFNDQDYTLLFDWKTRIALIIKKLFKDVVFDLATIAVNLTKLDRLTVGKHFLVTKDSNVLGVITRIEGNINKTILILIKGYWNAISYDPDSDLEKL